MYLLHTCIVNPINLLNDKIITQALAKFLKCVKWEITGEERQALDLLERWTPMDVQDALELLGPTFTHPSVRAYAVARLKQALDEVIQLNIINYICYAFFLMPCYYDIH